MEYSEENNNDRNSDNEYDSQDSNAEGYYENQESLENEDSNDSPSKVSPTKNILDKILSENRPIIHESPIGGILEDTGNFVSDESEVIYEGGENIIPFHEVEQDLITIYMPSERSSILTMCGAIGLLPEKFWTELKKNGIKHKNSDEDILCTEIILPSVQKGQLAPIEIGPFLETKKIFFNMLDKSGIRWEKVNRGIVAVSKKPFHSNMLRLCGDVNRIGPLMQKELSRWAVLDMGTNCWDFNVSNEHLVVNFMKQHGWSVRYAGKEFHEGNSKYVDEKGNLKPISQKTSKQKLDIISGKMAGKLMNNRKKRLSFHTPIVEETEYTRFRLGDIVTWTDKDGRQEGLVEQVNNEYFVVTNMDTREEYPPFKQTSEYIKVIERNNSFENFPIGIAVTSQHIKQARVIRHKLDSLVVETYNGDVEEISIRDPSLKILKIDAHLRSNQFRPKQTIKYRLVGTKRWVQGTVLSVKEDSINVIVMQDKISVQDQGILRSGIWANETNAKVVGIRQDQIDFETSDDVSTTWEIGSEVYFLDVFSRDGDKEEYRLDVAAHKGRILTANIRDNSLLQATHIKIPLTCLSLTIVLPESKKKSDYLTFDRYEPDLTHENINRRARNMVTSKFKSIILNYMQGKEYSSKADQSEDASRINVIGRWKIEDAIELEENLWNKNENLMDYLYHALLLSMALQSDDIGIGMYAVFFRKHVRSQLFAFSQLHKATLEYILPELTKNPNLDDLQYGEAIATLKHIIHEWIADFMHEVKSRKEGDVTARIKPRMKPYSKYSNNIGKFVIKNIHDLCSNIGSEEIPTESLVLCYEGGKFYCYSVQDVVKNIEKADSSNEIPVNPFTGVEWDSTFIKRIREMFMNTDEGRDHLAQLPKPNRTYNLVTGDVIPQKDFHKTVKGVTITELLNICPEKAGRCLDLEAGQLMQTMAIHLIKNIVATLEPVSNRSYFETESIVKAARIWLNDFSGPEAGMTDNAVYNALFQTIAHELNSVTGSILKDTNSLIYKEYTYADELMESEKRQNRGLETSMKGILTFGIIIYSFLKLTIEPLKNQEVITYDMIVDRVKSQDYLLFVFGTELPMTYEERYGFSPLSSPIKQATEEPTILAISGEIPKDNPQTYAKENTLVKNLYAIQNSLINQKIAKKEPKYTFSVTAGHEIYKFITKFIKGILDTNDETTFNQESMFNMLNAYILNIDISDDFSKTLLVPVTNYMNHSENLSTDSLSKLSKAQSSLTSILKNENYNIKFIGGSANVLSFAVGKLIYYLISNIRKTKGKDISSEEILNEIENDDNLEKINQIF